MVEVMACPGGCIGGGGQPYFVETGTIRKRMKNLYRIDSAESVRLSHENEHIKQLYKEFLGEPGSPVSHKLLHTKYTSRKEKVSG
ncbi:MAG: iron hydrogenase small subunit [Planctomycetota bacterium]|nr:iron hydrogenase small subunit [Planctomycetota bacterium]